MSIDIVSTDKNDTDDIIAIISNGKSVKFSNYEVTDNSTDVTLILICEEEQYYSMQDLLDNLDSTRTRDVIIDIINSDIQTDDTAVLNIEISFLDERNLGRFMTRILEAHEFMGFITSNNVLRIIDMVHGQ